MVVSHPDLNVPREKGGYSEIPDDELNHRGYVAVIFHVGCDQRAQSLVMGQTDDGENDPEKHCEQPRARRQLYRRRQTFQDQVAIVAREQGDRVEVQLRYSVCVPREVGYLAALETVRTAGHGVTSPGRAVERPPGTCNVGSSSISATLTAMGAATAKAMASATSAACGSSNPLMNRS